MNDLFIDNNTKICKICNKAVINLGNHIYHSHKSITYKQYYDDYLKTPEDGLCKICNKPTVFNTKTKLYKNCCSKECQIKYTIQRTKSTLIEKYGVDNPFKSKELMAESFKNKDYNSIQAKIQQTCKEKYGAKCYPQIEEYKNKTKETCNKKYGSDYFVQTEEFKTKSQNTKKLLYNDKNYTNMEKSKQTCLQKYGVEHYSQTQECKNKVVNTSLEKYGVNHYSQTNECKEKIQKTCLEKYNKTSYLGSDDWRKKTTEYYQKNYGVNCYAQTPDFKNRVSQKPYETYNYANMVRFKYDNELCKCLCDICSNEYTIDLHTLRTRKQQNHILCTICNPLEKQYSIAEKELLSLVQQYYKGEILENDRNVLNGKEIDIYLPELKLGFEFDGTYWHADPRFYAEDEIIDGKNLTAKDIWEKDHDKDVLAESLGIKLIRVKEHDWITVKERVIGYIENLLT